MQIASYSIDCSVLWLFPCSPNLLVLIETDADLKHFSLTKKHAYRTSNIASHFWNRLECNCTNCQKSTKNPPLFSWYFLHFLANDGQLFPGTF